MHVTFNPQTIDWSTFIQSNSNLSPLIEFEGENQLLQFGHGDHSPTEYSVFQGLPYQRGAGIGSIFRSLMRYILPLGKKVGTALGREGIETGQRIFNNIIQGGDLKETVLNESKKGVKNLLDKAVQKVSPQSGEGGVGKYKKTNNIKSLPPIPKGSNLRTIIPPPSLTTNPLKQQTASAINSIFKAKKKKHTGSKKPRTDSLGFY